MTKVFVKIAAFSFALIPAYSRKTTIFPILVRDSVTLVVCREVKYTVKYSASLGTKIILANYIWLCQIWLRHYQKNRKNPVSLSSVSFEQRQILWKHDRKMTVFSFFFQVVSNIREYSNNGIARKVGQMISMRSENNYLMMSRKVFGITKFNGCFSFDHRVYFRI